MEINEIGDDASTQVVALEIKGKEEDILYDKEESEPMPPLTASKEGSVDNEFVGSRVAESVRDTSFSGNSGDGISLSAAGRGEDSSDENADTNRGMSTLQKQMFNQIDHMRPVQNDSGVPYSGTNTNLTLSNIGVHMAETCPNSGMDMNIFSVHATHTEEDQKRRRREKRRQSNRESAKRSRIRRQQQCEKLHEEAETLKREISELPNELRRLSEECVKIDEENNSLIDEMEKMYGSYAVADLKAVKLGSSDDGCNCIESQISIRESKSPPTPHQKDARLTHQKEASPTPETRIFGCTLRPNCA